MSHVNGVAISLDWFQFAWFSPDPVIAPIPTVAWSEITSCDARPNDMKNTASGATDNEPTCCTPVVVSLCRNEVPRSTSRSRYRIANWYALAGAVVKSIVQPSAVGVHESAIASAVVGSVWSSISTHLVRA